MGKQITITLPDKVYQALAKAGEDLEETGAEYVKRKLVEAYSSKEGVEINLKPVVIAPDPRQAELPLDGAPAAAAEVLAVWLPPSDVEVRGP